MEEVVRARVFPEPLLPIGVEPTRDETLALVAAIRAFAAGGGRDRVDPFEAYLQRFPSSPWRASLLANLGLNYRRSGRFTKALDVWTQAWSLSRDGADPASRAVAFRAIGELLELNARLGRMERLRELLADVEGLDITGGASEKVAGARQALWLMVNEPEEHFRCGPYALGNVLRTLAPGSPVSPVVDRFPSTNKGTSLLQMRDLSMAAGEPMQAAFWEGRGDVIVPAIVHWRLGHFAAVVRRDGNQVLVQDPTFGDEWWMSLAAFTSEASGYFLVPGGALPEEWRLVADAEAGTIWGSGVPTGIDPSDFGPECGDCGGSGGGRGDGGGLGDGFGMPVLSIHLTAVSVAARDTPLWYTPRRGPAVAFALKYNQRDAYQPQTFSYANLGPKWTFDWFSYLEDDPGNPAAPVTVYQRGGGWETAIGYDPSTGTYAQTVRARAIIRRTSSNPIRYERELPDGSVEVFAQPESGITMPRRVFMTEIRDPQGNSLSFTWDAQLRMVAATDAIGQVTTIDYEDAAYPLRITKVTDPFGRTATFEYGPDGRLFRITDLLDLSSSFVYGYADGLRQMTTPYGTWALTYGEEGVQRWAEITDPLGGRERVEYASTNLGGATFPVPSGMQGDLGSNHNLSFHWDRHAMALAPGRVESATLYHWARPSHGARQATGAVFGRRRPGEQFEWTNYVNAGGYFSEGTMRRPSAIGRVLDDGTSQVTRFEYNARGSVTKRIDPVGRETVYEYASNGIDVIAVQQKNGGAFDTIETRTYNGQHLPLTITDAAGQTTTYTYNAFGQVTSFTNAKGEASAYAYDPEGRLLTVTAPLNAVTTYSYDLLSRVESLTGPDGYVRTFNYDVAGRPVRTTYPDGTYDLIVYDRLDAVEQRDRMGRIRRLAYDALRRLRSTRDPLGRIVTQEWCDCGGGLSALVDGNGNRTAWNHDLAGRVIKETRADGRETTYTYESATNRLSSMTDPKGQVTTYAYFADDRVKDVHFTNEQVPTADVGYTYDAYGRVATMTDGTGVTTYAYHPAGGPGGTQLATVDGPAAQDTVVYGYDELGRSVLQSVNGAATTWTFDPSGRMTSETNDTGAFNLTYDGGTNRISRIVYPNGQSVDYYYFQHSGDHRLQTIHHKYPTGATLSRHDYTYDVVGNILTWRQEDGSGVATWTYEMDRANQLRAAVRVASGAQPVQTSFAYSYDAGGNRLSEQVNDVVVGATHSKANELVSQQPAGLMAFRGTVTEPAVVTLNGVPAAVDATNQFTVSAAVPSGTSPITITARDASGNLAQREYQVTNAGGARALTYDANGNLTSDGTRTFEWDARNRLVATESGPNRTEFSYDGSGKAVRVIEKVAGVTVSETLRVWCGDTLCEERTSGGTLLGRFHSMSYQSNGATLFVARDHIGSVRAVTDAGGTLQSGFDYDPYGRQTVVAGAGLSAFGFTGHRLLGDTGLLLTRHRVFDPELGRWLSEDPAGFADGPNLYAYVQNDPSNKFDPLGLKGCAGCCPDEKVTIWICKRPLNAWYGAFISHSYVCCGGANKACFGHANNNLGVGERIPAEPRPDGECTPKKACPDEYNAKCNNPTSPCNASTFGWNCHNWANWDGRASSACGGNSPPPASRFGSAKVG